MQECPVDAMERANQNKLLEQKAFMTLNPHYCEQISEKVDAEVCTISLLGKAMEESQLSKTVCQNIRDPQNRADCYGYLFAENGDIENCFLIENDKKSLASCLGDIRVLFNPKTQINSLEVCKKMANEGLNLWRDQCVVSYMIKHNSADINLCTALENHTSFYNCVKNAGLRLKDSGVCEKITEIEPFPENYPSFVFSVSGCKHWVENNGSFEGLKE